MATPQVQFAGLDLSTATIYSTQTNFNGFIRIKARVRVDQYHN